MSLFVISQRYRVLTVQIIDSTQNVLDTDFEKVRKFLVSKNNILKFRKWFKYGLRTSAFSTGVLLETTFIAPFHMEQ